MNKEQLEKVRETIKNLEKEHILMLQLDIVYELDCQLQEKLSDGDYCKLYNEIEYTYLKVEGVELGTIVRCALDHMEDIINENEDFDLREECCYYA